MSKKKNPEDKKSAGRHLMFATAEELQSKISEYFENGCIDKKKVFTKLGNEIELPVPTFTGLCLFLGFCDRQSFYDYEKRPEFSCTMKKARTFIEREYEQQLSSGNCTGAIFALKNFGWKDKQEFEVKTEEVPRFITRPRSERNNPIEEG